MQISIKNKIPRTAVELFKILPEGLLCEVIENTLYITPAPNFFHQSVVMDLASDIHVHVKQKKMGKCIPSPIDVYLDSENAFQPDIIFIAENNKGIIIDGKIKGTPDLIIEILSPGSIKHDTITKRKVYERNGVNEYFIVNPSTKAVITYYLRNKKFEKQISKQGKVVSKLLKKTFSF